MGRIPPPTFAPRDLGPPPLRQRAPLPPAREPAPEPGQFGEVLLCLCAGAALAVVLSLLLPRPFAWVLCAIPHEMGHATVGCLLGLPSTPAISLRGEAWTGHGAFRPWLAVACPVVLGAAALLLRERRGAMLGLGAAALLLPVLAFSRAGEVLTIAGGHLAELSFAACAYAVVVTGGRTGSRAERIAGAVAGAIVQFANLRLCFGLMTSAAARATYAGNGSLGIKNDYLRLSQDVFGCRLETVGFAMLLVGLCALPLGLWAGHLRRHGG